MVKELNNHRTRAFIIRPDGKFLIMVRNFRKQAGKSYPVILLPGGGVDPGESSEVALIREIDEELGIKITDVNFIWKFKISRKCDTVEKVYFPGVDTVNNEFDFYIAKTNNSNKPKMLEPEKFDAVDWVSKDELESFANKHSVVEIGEGIKQAMKYINFKTSLESLTSPRYLLW